MPLPVAVVNGASGRVVAGNRAWRALMAAEDGADRDRTLAQMFPDAPAAILRASPATIRRARLATTRPDQGASWWDIDLADYPTIPGALLAVARDVTEHVLAVREAEGEHAALRETGTRLHLAQEAAGIGTWECHVESGGQAWSPQQFRLHGLDPARDRPPSMAEWFGWVHEDDRAALLAFLEPDGQDTLRAEFRIRRRDTGDDHWLLNLGRVMARRADGRPARLIGVNLDITERRAEHDALRESEARLRLAGEAARVFAWDWHVASGSVTWDAGLEAALGLPRGGFGGTVEAFRDLVHSEDLPSVERALRRALDGETEEYVAEFRMRRGDGSLRWTATRAMVLRDAAGRPARVIGMDHDITERKAAESRAGLADRVNGAGLLQRLADAAHTVSAEIQKREELQTALLQAQKLEALGELTAGIAHDFNNILAAVLGCFDLIDRRTQEPRILELTGRGRKAAQRADQLTRRLLGFVRQDRLAPSVVEVAAILRAADDLATHTVGANIARRVEIVGEPWPVLADANQLEVALLNLMVNARDAMPKGGTLTLAGRNLPPEERPEQLPPGQYVGIAVRDTGEGMPPEVLARATDPFFTTKPVGKGTGLGLPMVRRFAAEAGGCLAIRSAVGAGTEVEIVLPRAALRAMSADAVADGDPALAPRHGDAAILLVEDDPHVRAIVAGYLRDLGYRVTEAADAEAASVLAHDIAALDLLLTDVALPGVDGLDLSRRLRAERPGLPVLFMSGLAERAALAGESVLGKPFSGPELAAAVHRLLGRGAASVATDGTGLLRRLRSPGLRTVYLAWRAARGEAFLPQLASLDLAALPHADCAFVAAVTAGADGVAFHYVSVGAALTARLGGAAGEPVAAEADEAIGGLAAAYRRCARTSAPAYQFARYDFGDGAPVAFERLLLPMSDDGSTLDHLLGYAVFDGPTAAPGEETRP